MAAHRRSRSAWKRLPASILLGAVMALLARQPLAAADKSPRFTALDPIPAGLGVVYLFKDTGYGKGHHAQYFDNRFVGVLTKGSYIPVLALPGAHTVSSTLVYSQTGLGPGEVYGLPVQLTVEAGKSYYLNIKGAFRPHLEPADDRGVTKELPKCVRASFELAQPFFASYQADTYMAAAVARDAAGDRQGAAQAVAAALADYRTSAAQFTAGAAKMKKDRAWAPLLIALSATLTLTLQEAYLHETGKFPVGVLTLSQMRGESAREADASTDAKVGSLSDAVTVYTRLGRSFEGYGKLLENAAQCYAASGTEPLGGCMKAAGMK